MSQSNVNHDSTTTSSTQESQHNRQQQEQNEDESYHHCRTVGIALIVETIGHGAKLVFRYPAGPSNNDNNDNDNNHTFYTLPSRTMEKLFRPKAPHCGRPLTLSFGETIFCCWAVSLNHQHHNNHNENGSAVVNTDGDDNNGNGTPSSDVAVGSNKLILFSVIVALIPETTNEAHTYNNNSNNINSKLPHTIIASRVGVVEGKAATTRISTTDPIRQAIQSVHLSLSRLCRILLREEERCEYISHESSRLLQIKEEQKNNKSLYVFMEEYHNELLQIMMSSSTSNSAHNGNNNNKRCHGNLVREFAQVYHALARNNNWNVGISNTTSNNTKPDGIVYINNHVGVSIEPVYQIPSSYHHHKNLLLNSSSLSSNNASDYSLARPYHTLLLRNSSPDDILQNLRSNSIGPHQYLSKLILMVNPYKSLADIAVDAVIPLPEVLFLASQLVERGLGTISSVISSSSKFVCKDGKLLQDLALKFALRFGTGVPIGIATSIITSRGVTLGTILSNLNFNVLGVRLQAQITSSSKSLQEHGRANTSHHRLPIYTTRFPTTNTKTLTSTLSRGDRKRDIVCSMVTWLRAHEVIIELKEYLISISNTTNTTANTTTTTTPQQPKITNAVIDALHKPRTVTIPSHITRTLTPAMFKDFIAPRNTTKYIANTTNTEPQISPPPLTYKIQSKTIPPQKPNPTIYTSEEEELYTTSLKANYLNGTISTDAFCWKMRIDLKTLFVLKEWGRNEGVLKFILRCPMPGDDWT